MGRVKIISTDTGNLKKLLNNKSIVVNSNVDAGLMRETIVVAYAFEADREQNSIVNLDKSEKFAREQNWV